MGKDVVRLALSVDWLCARLRLVLGTPGDRLVCWGGAGEHIEPGLGDERTLVDL